MEGSGFGPRPVLPIRDVETGRTPGMQFLGHTAGKRIRPRVENTKRERGSEIAGRPAYCDAAVYPHLEYAHERHTAHPPSCSIMPPHSGHCGQ